MKRLLCCVVMIGLSTSAHADSFSFVLAGHRIRIAAPRNCYAASCVSVAIPKIVHARRKRSDDVAAQDAAPAKQAAAPAAAAPAQSAAPAPAPLQLQPAPRLTAAVPPPPAPSPPSPAPQLAATESKPAAPPPLPAPAEPVKIEPGEKPPAETPAVETAPVIKVVQIKPPQAKPPQPADAARADTPIGDWQTEGKTGSVRIEACGQALCGYLIDASTSAKGESILINMKPNGAREWRGSIFSRASGNTYNATMTLKRGDLLRVEACAFAHFFCSGNDWMRIGNPDALITSGDAPPQPRS